MRVRFLTMTREVNVRGPRHAVPRHRRDAMADLIAIGYPDETTAHAAADEARRLAAELIIQLDAIAVISRDKDGSYHVP
jgi:2-methylcitrate dehydratase PrpD